MPKREMLKLLLLSIVLLPIYCISFLFPRNRNLWIFGCWDGQKFADNPKYLFLYVKRNHPEIRAIWLSHRAEVVQDLIDKGFEAYKALSIKGFWYSFRAGCVVISNSLVDINCFAISRAKKIQLWHGTPLKKIGYDTNLHMFWRYRGGAKLRAVLWFRYNIIIAASKEAKEKLASGFKESEDRLRVTGYPRNDGLFDTAWLASNRCDYIDNIRNKVSFKYVITYLPTHRQLGRKKMDLFARYGFEINATEQILENLDAILIIKAHYFDKGFNITIRNGYSQRLYTPSDGELPDVYPLLKETDILITDYASVYFDYLLLNRPIIFTPFDIVEYTMEEGFYYDYNEVTPGPKAKDWRGVFELIHQVIQNDRWKQEREAICNRFNDYTDNENSRRVFEAIKETLKS